MLYNRNIDIFSALAEPNRRTIVELLTSRGPLSATEIYEQFRVSPPAISQHLKVLREANVVCMEKRTQQHVYQLNPDALCELEGWASYMTHLWNQRFDTLERVLEAEKKKKEKKMSKVLSKDGTPIAFDRSGQGPALIMVAGATATRSTAGEAAASLSPNFTVFAYDRRGRGESGDTAPYAVEREVEDIDALINEAGGSAFVFGHSSGAVLALEAARMLPTRIPKLAVYEPPFIIDNSRPPIPDDYITTLNKLIAEDRRGDAAEYFMTKVVGISPEEVAYMRNSPMWEAIKKVAHTIPYDGTIMGDTMSGNPLSIRKYASVPVPTLVMDGGNSPAFMHHGAEELTKILPNAQHRRLAGQDHGVAGDVLMPALVEFFIG
ncbi:MAG: metalloregulator ArsR/SmtB family transcription factor [Ktedonobacteraceae bacterium]